jgi:hypothetical protein
MLKPSNFTTPRSMNEVMFLHWADPIERPEPRPSYLWKWLAWSAFALVFLALLVVGR